LGDLDERFNIAGLSLSYLESTWAATESEQAALLVDGPTCVVLT